MPRPTEFTYQGIGYRAFKEYGCYFGIGQWQAKPYLSYIPMNEDGTPSAIGSTARDLDDQNQTVERPKVYQVGEVTNVDDDQEFVNAINAEFGTSFTMAHFPGR